LLRKPALREPCSPPKIPPLIFHFGAPAMRARSLILIAALVASTAGCADCFLHTLVAAFPESYSGGGGSVDEKQADLDRRLLEYKDYETTHGSIVDK
jgi:hypothetical protein